MTDPRDRKPDDPMAGIHWDLDRSMSHAQYLRLDRVLGARHFEVHAADPPVPALLRRELPTPSLYNEALRLLARRGFEIPPERTERDWTQSCQAHPAVKAAWLAIYCDSNAHWDLYELAEKPVDLEYRLQQWHFAHLKTVERIIGFKRGTDGLAGVGYLEHVLKRSCLPELSNLRTQI